MKKHECKYCGGPCNPHGKKERIIHHPNLHDFDGVIHYHARRYICKHCSKTFFEQNHFTFEGFNNSFAVINRVIRYLADLDLAFKRIAELTEISPTSVQLYLDSYVSILKPTLPKCLGIDELHSKKMSASNSAYLCVLIDNANRYPIDILNSRSKRKLERYFQMYSSKEKSKVKFVTIDMWLAYYDIAKKHFPKAKIAVDPFHVVKGVCDAFSRMRLNIMNQTPYGSDAYYLLKNWHKLLEIKDINLDNEPQHNQHFKRKVNKRQLFNMLLEVSDRLKIAYELKSNYQFFNDTATIENCEVWLDHLIKEFQESGISELNECTNTLINWHDQIINSFERPYHNRKQSNALAENINGKIRSYLALIYGAVNFQRLRKRVLLALNKKVFYSISDRLESDKQEGRKRGPYNKK
ncbi:ISL3 family transposase [Breznakia sp. OttesenSCG-928-G09]|nr:ISL3 family transposase [Breznakia sp. OttesenSCG-928-G09]